VDLRAWLLGLALALPLCAGAAAAATTPPAADAKTDVHPGEHQAAGQFAGMGHTPQEQAELDELGQAISQYESESKDFRREIQQLVEKKYEDKRALLANSYEKSISDLEGVERRDRLDAIAQFEEFLHRYPGDPKYTPDVMFRLAELYYERSADEQAVAMRVYEEKLKAQDPSKQGEPIPEPQIHFDDSIRIYRNLLAQFPDYKLNDGVQYLLGYCLEKQGDFEKGKESYLTLINHYPKSKFATEAWVRLGEYYFDAVSDPNALPQAAQAYEAAIRDQSHPLYDKALYKLGWVYYRMDRFDEAVDRFIRLVDYYQQKSKEKGDEDAGGDLRAEALQYTAISFADEKWGSLAKAQEIFRRLGGRPYEAEVYRRLGQVYFDQTRHADAVAAYQLVLQKDPLAKDAPQIQQKIVEAYERDRKLDEAFGQSNRLAAAYGPGTPWYDKHRHDPDVVNAAQTLVEKSLSSSAIYHHQQALALKQQGKFVEAKDAFQVAAKAYGGYLAHFPHSKGAYEFTFYMAECQYNSLQFADAARTYEAVRDSPADNKYQKDASFSAVLAWQKVVEQAQADHQLKEYKVLRSSERSEKEKIVPVPLAELEKHLVSASDAYVSHFPKEERAPTIAYKAAELYYAHDDFPEARKRFEAIIQDYPKNEVAKFATNLTVETFLVDKDWRSVEAVAEKLAANTQVIDPKSDLHRDLVKFKLAGRFKLADELMAKKDYLGAAGKYIALVDEEPKHEFADKALNNAAVAYENSNRFDSALKLYERIFREYPASKLADTALFRVAVNAEKSFDFDKAVTNYQKLVQDYPASKNREAALFDEARLLEGLQRYREAAVAFTRYAELFPTAEDAPKNIYRAALIYEKENDYKGEVKALNEFIHKFGNKSAQQELVIDAQKRVADALEKLGDEKGALKAYATAAGEFDRKALKPDQYPVAADAAAQARFQLAEHEFKLFDQLKIGGRGKALEKSFKVKAAAAKKVQDTFAEVFKYKRLEWTLAALYRRGFSLERFGTTIMETPVPPDVKHLGDEAVAAYQDLLAQKTAALEDKAVESYIGTMSEARKNHISNEWTKKTLESLSRYRPKEYPVLKEPKALISTDAVYPEGLWGGAPGQEVK
jgi:TolA-binding protein